MRGMPAIDGHLPGGGITRGVGALRGLWRADAPGLILRPFRARDGGAAPIDMPDEGKHSRLGS